MERAFACHGGDDLAAVKTAVLDENFAGVFLPPTTTPAT